VKKLLKRGYLNISPEVFASISGYAATKCFGVKGMAPAYRGDRIVRILRGDQISQGVKISEEPDGSINIELHIIVRHGVNISAVCRAIIVEVRYVVQNMTGVKVKNVDVCVDSIMHD